MSPSSLTRQRLLRVLAVALVYALLGTAGLALAVPPSYASPIFPASGFALAAALCYGRRGLAGAWFGSLAMHVLAPPYIYDLTLSSTLLAISIATAAALQAWGGRTLILLLLKKNWRRLAQEKDVLMFLGLGGLVACLISPSLSVTSLYLAGAISAHDFFHSWWTWYVGDALGVLLCAPLSLFFFERHDPLWHSRTRSILVPLLAVLTLVAAAFYEAKRMEDRDIQSQLATQGTRIKAQLENRLDHDLTVLAYIARLMEVTPSVKHEQFARFSTPARKHHPEFSSLRFHYQIPAHKRAEFEAAMSALTPKQHYRIFDPPEAKPEQIKEQEARRNYLPLAYLHPQRDDLPALGQDSALLPDFRDAAQRAEHSSRAAITPLVPTEDGGRFFALMPAYGAAPSTIAPPLIGFAVAEIRIEPFITLATGQVLDPDLVLQLENPAAPGQSQVLYHSPEQAARLDYAWQGSLSIDNQTWHVRVRPTAKWLQHNRSWTAWTVGVAGLLFTTLLQVLLLVITARATFIRQKVEEQTAEIKAKSRALEASEERYRHLFDDARVPMLLIDSLDGAILDANQAAAAYYGHPCAHLKRMRMADITQTPETTAPGNTVVEQVRYGDKDVFEFTHRLANGERREVEVRSGPMKVRGRSLLYSIIQDVTERKRLEREVRAYQGQLEELVAKRTAQLSASESHTRLILESTADGLFGLDTHGRISFMNPAACRILGYSEENAIGRNAHALLHHSKPDGSPYPALSCPALASLKQGQVITVGDEVYWNAEGQPIPVIYSVHPMIRDGVTLGSVVSFVDITERKAVEEAREAARQEAERLARVKSEFLANMSHEIRTPLNGVLGVAQLGYRRSQDSKEYFGRILDSGQLLLGIINDILDFSKIEAGKLKIEEVPFQPRQLLEQSAAILADRAHAKHLDFKVLQDDSLPDSCLGDPLRIKQILVNLLSNAIKFTEHGYVVLHGWMSEGHLCFSVADTGIGMTQSQMARAFIAFEQADGSTTRKFGGTGLGLSISQQLAELMGGRIRVEGSMGKGCTFELRLPCNGICHAQTTETPSVEASASPPDDAPRLSGLSILVVEDNPVNQLVLEDFLGSEGAEVHIVTHGREALARLAQDGSEHYHLALVDLQMPEMDGQETARRMLAIAPDLPVIAQTAHASPEEKARSLAAGMVGYISKPLDIEELISEVLQHARRHDAQRHKQKQLR